MSLSQNIPESRKRLSSLVRGAGDVIRVSDAAHILHLDQSAAAKVLARWTVQGWLRRAGHGVYVPAAIDSLESEHVLGDPWVLVPALFAPCYIGGRTAAEYWDLTEQIFNDAVVFTTKAIRQKSQRHHGATYTLKHIAPEKIFGTKTLWRANTRVPISDVHRTVVDLLDNPAIGGGIQHVADCLAAYLRRTDRDDSQLIGYAEKLGNGAVFKRLGFLVESAVGPDKLVEACRALLTKGNVKLDPALECPKLVTRWRLWVPPFSVGGTRQ